MNTATTPAPSSSLVSGTGSILRAGTVVLGLVGVACGAVLLFATPPAGHLDAGVLRLIGAGVAVFAGVLPLAAAATRSSAARLVAAFLATVAHGLTLNGQISMWPQSFLALAGVVLAIAVVAFQAVDLGGSGDTPGRRI